MLMCFRDNATFNSRKNWNFRIVFLSGVFVKFDHIAREELISECVSVYEIKELYSAS